MSVTHEDKRPNSDANANDEAKQNQSAKHEEQDRSDLVRVPEATHTEVKVEPNDEDWDAESLVAFESLEKKRKARQRKRLIRIGIIVAVIAVAVVLVIMNMMSPKEEEEEVIPDMVTVERRDFELTVSSDGALEPKTSSIVTPEVGGVIENLDVVVGQRVKKGDVLFTLKNDQLDKDVADAEHEVTSAERAVGKAQRERDKAWAKYNSDFDEYLQLAASEEGEGATPPEAPDDEDLLESIESAEIELEGKREAYEAAVEKASKRTVTAPESGAVLAVNAVNGMSIEEGGTTSSESNTGPLVQIADVSSMKVTISVDESEITKLKAGQPARVTFSAIPELELDAKVVEIATAAAGSDESGYGGGGGSASFAVKLEIPKPDKRLKPGMTASVTIITKSVSDALVVPTSALTILEENEDGSGTAMAEVVVNEETYETETHDVTFSTKDLADAVITEGLEEGDVVMLPNFEGGEGLEDLVGELSDAEGIE